MTSVCHLGQKKYCLVSKSSGLRRDYQTQSDKKKASATYSAALSFIRDPHLLLHLMESTICNELESFQVLFTRMGLQLLGSIWSPFYHPLSAPLSSCDSAKNIIHSWCRIPALAVFSALGCPEQSMKYAKPIVGNNLNNLSVTTWILVKGVCWLSNSAFLQCMPRNGQRVPLILIVLRHCC